MSAVAMPLNPTALRPLKERTPLLDRRLTNPMFNDQKMKLGLFGTNCSFGLIISAAPTTYELTWDHTLRIAQQADAIGFEALVPIARWRGFGGSTNFNGTNFETYTWAAGLAQATKNIAVFSTSHLPTVHPIVAAKAAVTVDHISRGRFGLNLVMGWFTPEMNMFNGSQLEHDARYVFGQEWLDFVLRLWAEEGAFDVDGEFFTSRGVEAYPKPYQAPRPILLNAGSSMAGIAFSARNVDVNFSALDSIEAMTDYSRTIKATARDEYSRSISAMTFGLVVCRDTEAEAKQAFKAVVDAGDWKAAENLMSVLGIESQSFGPQIRALQERFIAGWGGYPIVGTPDQVVSELQKLSDAGMDGMIMGLIDYSEELTYFEKNVMPLLKQAGLRH